MKITEKVIGSPVVTTYLRWITKNTTISCVQSLNTQAQLVTLMKVKQSVVFIFYVYAMVVAFLLFHILPFTILVNYQMSFQMFLSRVKYLQDNMVSI